MAPQLRRLALHAPAVGAIMGALGCLVCIALMSAAASSKLPTPDATFYTVVALALGYREQRFRELFKRLVDTVILPAEEKKKTQARC
jgi:hypothetical protein